MAEKDEISSAETLKRFAQRVTTSSTKERIGLLQNVTVCVGKPDFPETAVKGVFKFLSLTIGRYEDNRSRQAVKNLVRELAKVHPTATLKNVSSALSSEAEAQRKRVHASHNSSGNALFALTWTCIVLKEVWTLDKKCDRNDLKNLVNVQCGLVYGALAAGWKSVSESTLRKMSGLFSVKKEIAAEYAELLQEIESSMYNMSAIAMLLKYLSKTKDQAKLKGPFVEMYVKQILGSRSKPPALLLKSSSELLRHINHAEFKDQVLPALQKAMLRSPEIILEAVGSLLLSVTIDLGQYIQDLSKPLGVQLCSKEDICRQEAVAAFTNLAKQCSDSGAVEKLVTHLFGVLNGSEGKLTIADQRISVLQAIGNVSQNSVSGANTLESLSTTVVEKFLPLLQSEVHEGTLVTALNMMSLWCARFYTNVPDKLIEWFKKGITLKTSTSAVRNAYLQCMNASFHGDTLTQTPKLLDILIQTINKAVNQSSQSQLVTEALTACCLLAKFSVVDDIQSEAKMGPFWSFTMEKNKQFFLQEKFLSSVSDEALGSVVFLSEKLILEFPQKMTEKVSKPYYKALVYCLVHKSRAVRKSTEDVVKRLISLLGGTAVCLSLVKEYEEMLETQKLVDPEMVDSEKENISETTKYPAPVILARGLISVTSVLKVDSKDAETIAMATIRSAHHPCIVFANSSAWTDILYQLKLDARQFLVSYKDKCLECVLTDKILDECTQNALTTFVRVAPDVVLPNVVSYSTGLLGQSELLLVTQAEYGVFCCPEGELYDKSLLHQFEKSADGSSANIKRENKLYSYEEQMAELELKKELEKKKGKKPKEAIKLTKKQEEMLQAQTDKEADIRKRVTKLNDSLCCGCQIILACLHGNSQATCEFMKDLCGCLVPLLKSPLGAPEVSKVFLELGQAVFDDSTLGKKVSNIGLRMLDPACPVNAEWMWIPVKEQAMHIVQLLYERSVPDLSAPDRETEKFEAPAFVFIFFLLSVVLRNAGEVVGGDELTLSRAVKMIITHAKMRKTKEGNWSNPELLPHHDILRTLLQVVGTSSSSKIQQLASTALVEVAESISGGEGCGRATEKEIVVLLEALKLPSATSRDSALQALNSLAGVLPNIDDDLDLGLQIAQRVWVVSFDDDDNIRLLAENLREQLQLEEPYEDLCLPLIDDVIHPEMIVRKAAAKALEKTISCHPEFITSTIQQLKEKYEEKLYMPPPVLDSFGRQIGEPPLDEWEARSGVALALEKISPMLPTDQIEELFSFYVPHALGDRSPEVRTHMRDAALATVTAHGKENVNILLPVFENCLSSAPDTASFDAVRQSIVILMGSLAKHLDKDNPKIKPIVAQLIGALSTPSQEVQEAVANCLPPLVPGIKQNAPELVQKLLHLLLESDNYGERRGAAYGLAGLVRGLGITALKQLEIMSTLEQAVKDKKNPRRKEGALFAYEMLCTMLGKLFEPYVVHILPHLLLCFGDNSPYVRQAADDTAKAVMSMLTAHGVKLVLPSLLKGLEEDSWRTKTGAVELLGAMAFCAPKQLSACLPSIVPKISEVLTDSHAKVQSAGAQALKQIGKVIRNPEIQAIVPVLLDALQEPGKKTLLCLQILLETKFVHFIDAPSLALIMPVVERAFLDRNTETRKMAAQIIGNMYSLTDQKDLDPYIEKVIPGLKQSLLDPVPEVRTVSSRALGAMVKGMGGAKFDELLNWLMETLKCEQSSVDRSGAAQGLSEVIGGLGIQELHRLMPGIIQTAERSDIPSHVRDGYIMLYIYLPVVFEKDFLQYIGPIIPSILKALADESEYVRDTALRAGQRMINLYADTAIELLLPELEKGLFDDNWRIRFSSVQLLGDLLYKISGVSGKMSTETAHDDDNFGTESSQKVILKALGRERRDRVLAGLYMGRSDTALLVRQSALHVWKIIVAHTPLTLREILPTLFSLLLGCLASTSHDKRQVAARTLGDLVKKLGERVLPEIIPILEKGLDSDRADQRQGVCIGLSEIMKATSREHVSVYADSLVPTVRRALTDDLSEVREAAAETFDNLHSNIGQRALDEILPELLKQLDDDEKADSALDGLKQVMTVKSRVVLPYLVPQLTASPVNTRALSFLSSVAGDALTKHLSKILPALLSALSSKMDTPEEAQEIDYCRTVVLSVHDDVGVRTVMQELLAASQSPTASECWSAVVILHTFCEKTSADYSDYLPQLFRGLIGLFTNSSEKVLHAAWDCLNAVTKKIDVTEMFQHIADVRQAVRYAMSDYKGKNLPGFSLPKKGIAPVLPIFREGILNGSQDMKAQAADGLGELINITSAEALKPSVVNITGPLIRILGDRFSWQVKVAVLETLTLLLAKVGVQLKPFLPQLQTTFLKALNDPQRQVRLKSASALGKLTVIHTRVDPLFTELHSAVKIASDQSVRDTMLQALRFCICGAGEKMSDASRKGIMGTLVGMLGVQEDATRTATSGCVGSLCKILPEEELTEIMIQQLLDTAESGADWTLRHGRSQALAVALKEAAPKIWTPTFQSSIVKCLSGLIDSDKVPLCQSGLRGLGYALLHQTKSSELDPELVSLLVKGLKKDSNDVKLIVTQVSSLIASCDQPLPLSAVKILVPALVMGTKEKNSMVKSSSEYALISVLKLREGDAVLKQTLAELDAGMHESLSDVVNKSLNKLCKQPEPPLDEIDDTILK
uniref:EIF-2-alpha kinase activator GCN1-like n=1 Tax=Crassostrea virginica TaxID=6565 RepID=A0A8B8EHE3_CRAVI|nr:eIF-2-alpha kinase activator GCN1-like [Crassostrea virginica]